MPSFAIPANFVSGNVNSGYNAEVASNFMQGVVITNLHNDTYGHTKEVPMQGPFTNQWVGGLQSRHVALNQGSAADRLNIERGAQIEVETGPVNQ